jgi:hypothetical protein
MSTITLNLPPSAAEMLARLSPADKEKLAAFVQFWLSSFSGKQRTSALEKMKVIQQEVALKNLTESEIQALIEHSIT